MVRKTKVPTLKSKETVKLGQRAHHLLWFSLLTQAAFCTIVLCFAIASLLLGQVKNDDNGKTLNYNLITFIIGLWFPSPVYTLLVDSRTKEEDNHSESNVSICLNEDGTECDESGLTTLRDLPQADDGGLPPYSPNERI